jgi:hypothetical protein
MKSTVLPAVPKDSIETRPSPYLRGLSVNDILVLPGPEEKWEVKLRGAAWPFGSFAFEEGALESGRDFAKLWRCSVVMIDRAGRVRMRESYSGVA